MTAIISTSYGAFATIVTVAGNIVAMGAAITLGWKGRAKWEPVEEDVPKGPQKVATVIAALLVVIIWAQLNDIQYKSTLITIVIRCLFGLVVSLIIYGLLNGFIYTAVRKKKDEPEKSRVVEQVKVIGGIWLNSHARKRKGTREDPDDDKSQILTVQRMFDLSEYNKDELWPRPSQQIASALFTLGYLGLIVTGTVAVGSGAILTGLIIKASR
jgi:hypothetical protein